MPHSAGPDHDQRLKVLLKEFFEAFFLCFFPTWAARFEFLEIDWLDKELFLAPPQGEKRQLDLVARLRLRPGAPPPRAGSTDLVALVHVELELGQRFGRQGLNLLLDFGSQRAELSFHEPQGRPSLALLNAAFVGGLHEGFDLVIRLGVQQRLQPLILRLVQLRVGLQAFGQQEPPIVILSRTGDPFQPLGVQLGPPVRR